MVSHDPSPASGGAFHLLVGTYTGGRSEGIHVYRFDAQRGEVQPVSVAKTVNPSFLVASRDRRHVYAVNELPGDDAPASLRGGVSAFRFDPRTGELAFVNAVSSGGSDPCHLALSPDGRYLLVSNYSVAAEPGGSLAVLPLQADGALGAAVQIVRRPGQGPVQSRQAVSHVHSAVFAPDGRHVFVQDLGADRLDVYRYAPGAPGASAGSSQPLASSDVLVPAEPADIGMPAGSGPRHLLFAAHGRHAYLVSELSATLGVFRYDDGTLAPLQELPLAAAGFDGEQAGAALHLSPDGRFLYVSNRGDANEIAIFAVDPDDGRVRPVGRQSSLGRAPREFAIDAGGQWLIVGNQSSDCAYVFRRDRETGLLDPAPARFEIGAPVDFKLV
jgi:6-phosphogluconolactonase